MSRMDKVYKKYKAAKMNPQKFIDELGLDMNEAGGNLGMGVVRKETDLNNDEKQFLLAVERGDIPRARHFLEESQIYFNLNINCVDPLGRTALLIAIENENIEMIEILLNYNVELGDALLHAINEENVEAVELLLSHQQNNKKDLSGFLGGVPSSSFTPDITPIILAAHRDNYEIIKILLDRGDTIAKPHDVRCSCTECVSKSSEDSLNHSRSRINAYRALASPSLIALSSKDPILTAFELSWELKRLSRLENEFRFDYEALAKQCQNFAVDLLDQTRGSKELGIVLNHDTDSPVSEPSEGMMRLDRLKLAIKYKQKRFVAHPSCQQLLASLWYQGLPGFRRRHIIFKVLLTASVCLVYPLLSMMYLLLPKNSVGHFMRKPFIKFICHSASYLTFLFLLILASQRIEAIIRFGEYTNREKRGSPPTIIEWMIIIYVAGFVWAEIKQLWDQGAKQYIQDMWNILDFATNALYIATFTLKLVAYINVQKERETNSKTADMPRSHWDAYDPNLISEGLFAAANIFSTLKLVYIFTINPHLGPLSISLGRMVMDIMKFFFYYILVTFAFACGVNQLYWYYAEERRKECVNPKQGDTCDKQYKAIENLFEILQTLYFSGFGLVDYEMFELKEEHTFTQFTGKLMFGSYLLITIIVLLNMLIAMLSNSYQNISNDSDTEWKFARSKLWMSYFEEGGTVPPPFNIIPTPKSLWYLLLWFKDKLCRCTKKHKRSKWQSIRKLVKRVNEREARYQAVMRDLVKRYIMQRQRGDQDQGVTEDDLNEIKQDISSFRYELLEILRNNGMKTPTYTGQINKASSRRLGRRGSRRSTMERTLERPLKMDKANENGKEMYQMPKFLEKQTSNDSQISVGSDQSGTNSKNGEETRLDSSGRGLTDIPEEDDGTKERVQVNADTSPNRSGKKDEGLGESFDQQSEMSDASVRSAMNGSLNNSTNGFRNAGYDALPEEKEDTDLGSSMNSQGSDSMGQGSEFAELTLDPNRLQVPVDPAVEEIGAPSAGAEEGSPFAQKPASAVKKVSFQWGTEENGGAPDPDTYVYEGKGGKKFKRRPTGYPRGKNKSD